jgi:hypothetical protein
MKKGLAIILIIIGCLGVAFLGLVCILSPTPYLSIPIIIFATLVVGGIILLIRLKHGSTTNITQKEQNSNKKANNTAEYSILKTAKYYGQLIYVAGDDNCNLWLAYYGKRRCIKLTIDGVHFNLSSSDAIGFRLSAGMHTIRLFSMATKSVKVSDNEKIIYSLNESMLSFNAFKRVDIVKIKNATVSTTYNKIDSRLSALWCGLTIDVSVITTFIIEIEDGRKISINTPQNSAEYNYLLQYIQI